MWRGFKREWDDSPLLFRALWLVAFLGMALVWVALARRF
jgi:hypothetical protein